MLQINHKNVENEALLKYENMVANVEQKKKKFDKWVMHDFDYKS